MIDMWTGEKHWSDQERFIISGFEHIVLTVDDWSVEFIARFVVNGLEAQFLVVDRRCHSQLVFKTKSGYFHWSRKEDPFKCTISQFKSYVARDCCAYDDINKAHYFSIDNF